MYAVHHLMLCPQEPEEGITWVLEHSQGLSAKATLFLVAEPSLQCLLLLLRQSLIPIRILVWNGIVKQRSKGN